MKNLNEMYSAYREVAQNHAKARNHYFQLATQAYTQGEN